MTWPPQRRQPHGGCTTPRWRKTEEAHDRGRRGFGEDNAGYVCGMATPRPAGMPECTIELESRLGKLRIHFGIKTPRSTVYGSDQRDPQRSRPCSFTRKCPETGRGARRSSSGVSAGAILQGPDHASGSKSARSEKTSSGIPAGWPASHMSTRPRNASTAL